MNKSVDWGYYKRHIPNSVQIKSKISYEVVWIDAFKDEKTLGETRYNEKQIVILKGLSNKLTVVTYLHELLHAVQYEHEIGLTENQVLSFEKFFQYVLKSDNIFKSRKGKVK